MEAIEAITPLAACVDIGGTKALLGLVDRAGAIWAREKVYLAAEREPGELVAELAARLRALAGRSQVDWDRVQGIGYSTAGMMDVESGVIFASPNQGSWRDVPFRRLLEEAFDRPARIEMDANAAALGEAWLGVGRGADPFIYLVVGTGIGAGILVNGRILRGWRGTAGEVGHMVIDRRGPRCNCGGRGCLESLASGPAIARRARRAIARGRASRLAALDGGQAVTAETVFQAARAGDALALEIVDQTVDYLSIGLTNLIHLFNPRVIALGGGVGTGGADLLLGALQDAVAQRVGAWVDMQGTRLARAELGNEAGLLGAARSIWNYLDERQSWQPQRSGF